MPQVSVVIITKNEAGNIANCIAAAKKISSDIIVIDSGSTDATVSMARAAGAKVQSIVWEGYGAARNAGALLADHDWIFSLDADERVTNRFATAVKNIAFTDQNIVYRFKRINYFSGRKISYGSFAHDRVVRLYNKRKAQWNSVPVHEKLTGRNLRKIMTNASFIHFTARSETDYLQKITGYALLCALKYQQQGRKFLHVHRLLSPIFNFVKDYIFQLGFLDGRPGFIIARLNALYTWKKYQQAIVLPDGEKKQSRHPAFLQHSFRKIISFLS